VNQIFCEITLIRAALPQRYLSSDHKLPVSRTFRPGLFLPLRKSPLPALEALAQARASLGEV